MKVQLAAALLAACAWVHPAVAASPQPINGGQDMTGAWRATVTLLPGSEVCPAGCAYQALANYSRDGTLIQTAGIPNSSAGYGVWRRIGTRKFEAHSEYLVTTQTGQVVASTLIEITLDASGRAGNGTFEVTLPGFGKYQGTALFQRIGFVE